MPRLKTVQRQLTRLEGFKVTFRHPDGRKMRSDRSAVPQYTYERKAWGKWTVARWKNVRFYPSYAGFEVDVLNAEGEVMRGHTRLSNVRDSY